MRSEKYYKEFLKKSVAGLAVGNQDVLEQFTPLEWISASRITQIVSPTATDLISTLRVHLFHTILKYFGNQ